MAGRVKTCEFSDILERAALEARKAAGHLSMTLKLCYTIPMSPRLKSGFTVRALIRRAEVAGAQAFVVKKGSEEAGAIYLKINRLDRTCTVLSQVVAMDGERVWARPLGESCDEPKASAWFEKQQKFDPDLWIVEIEDREGRAFVDEKIV